MTLVPGDGDEVFPVHRAMMASASDYFKAMFTGTVNGTRVLTGLVCESVFKECHPAIATVFKSIFLDKET